MIDTRSIGELVSSLVADLADLVRKESQLIRAEVNEKAAMLGRAGGMLGAGAALLLAAFLCLVAAVILALSKAMDPLLATIIVGVVVGLGGFVLVRTAVKKMQPAELAPQRSAQQLRKDMNLVRGEVLKEQTS